MDKEIDYKECEYLSELPILVLAIHHKYNFKKGREWKAIAHQTAGLGCHHHYMYGTILKPKPEVLNKMYKIEKYWLGSDCGVFGVSLDTILEYRKQLKSLLKVDCNTCYNKFEEGIYPIDCSPAIVKKLCRDKTPNDFDDFIKWRTKLDRTFGFLGRWHLYILGENSD